MTPILIKYKHLSEKSFVVLQYRWRVRGTKSETSPSRRLAGRPLLLAIADDSLGRNPRGSPVILALVAVAKG